MVEWHYEMTEGAWGNRSGTALSMKAAKRSMRADLRSRYPGAKLPRLVKQPSLPDTQLYDLEGEDYEGFASFTTLDPEGMAEFTAGWGEEPSPYPLANPLALDNWGQAIGRSVMLLARSPAVKRMAVFVGRELGREALTHLLNMSKEERGAWLYKNLRRIPYLSSQLDRLSPEQKVAVTQAVAGALENKQVQRAIDKQLAHKVSANPRISDAEIQRKAQFYIDSFWEYADEYGYWEARGWLQEGPFRDFRVWMRVHPNTKHLATMLRSTRREYFRNWNQHAFEKLLGRVAAGTRPESRTNPKKKRRKAKRRNVHHEDALSRKTTRGHKRKERKRSVAKGHSRKPKHKGQAKLNPVQDLKAQVHDFAERLRSWNLKYDEFPDIRAWVTQNWTAPYGADAALDYLNGVAERRSESYWGQSTRSRQDIADEAERSRRLRAVYSDLAGDEVRQNPRLTRRPQAPYVWEENIYKNGKLVETVYYDDIQAFFRDIEQANPGGNQQVYDNWKEGSARHSTGYTDGAGNTWDLYFSKMRGTGARMNPKSGHHGSAGRYYEPRTDREAREYLSKLTDLLPAARFQSVIEELEEVAGGLNRWAQAKAYLIGAGEDRYLQKVYDSFGLYDLRENSCGCRHNPCPHTAHNPYKSKKPYKRRTERQKRAMRDRWVASEPKGPGGWNTYAVGFFTPGTHWAPKKVRARSRDEAIEKARKIVSKSPHWRGGRARVKRLD